MKVKLAKSAGFCMGVRRAMEIVLSEANKNKSSELYTLGPLIHNRQVLELLHSKGVKILEDARAGTGAKVVIRAHGIPPQVRSQLRSIKADVIDATCPKVARVQGIIKYYTKKGYTGIIVGDPDHPEVIGLKGYGGEKAWVISEESELPSLPIDHDRVFVVAQTTQNAKRYEEIVKKIKARSPNALVFDTICEATHQRQQEVRELAQQVDAVVVVGGYESGNTRRLVEIARSVGKPAFHVETPADLDTKELEKMEVIGVTAGASTPNWLIKDVVTAIQKIEGRKETLPGKIFRRAIKFMVLSNVAAASGAAALCYATDYFLYGLSKPLYPIITFLYIYAMHVLNRFLDRTASAYNEPERASFLIRHGKALALGGAISTLGAIGLSLKAGLPTFVALLVLSLLGIAYSLPIIPRIFPFGQRYRKIKDVPGSKTVSEALAWTALVVLIPLLGHPTHSWLTTTLAGTCVFLLAFVRAGIFDVLQFQGDLIAGSETLPILIGEKRTLFLLKVILCVTGGLVLGAVALSIMPSLYLLMLVSPMTLALSIWAYQRGLTVPGLTFEALIEGNFVLLGLIVALWIYL